MPTALPVPLLFVDDDTTNLIALRAIFESQELYDIVTATSGAAALEEVRKRDFALVVLDVRMPGMDGFETAERMHGLRAPPPPIIFVTGMDEDDTRPFRVYGDGVVDFIQKPIRPGMLRAKVATLAELYRARRRVTSSLRALIDVALALGRDRKSSDVARTITVEGASAIGADTCAVYTLDPDRKRLRLRAERGVAPEIVAGAGLLTEEDMPEVFRELQAATSCGVEVGGNFWFPVSAEGTVLGAMRIAFREGRVIGAEDRAVLEAVATQCAQGLLRATRFEREERERLRLEFLARAGAKLVSTLDYRETLAAVAQLAVPEIADWCSIHLVEPGVEAPTAVAVAHVDPTMVSSARELARRYPGDPSSPHGVAQVIRSGISELYREVPASMLEDAAVDAEHLRILRELQLESAMIVPLRGREGVFGAASFIYARSGRRYDEADLAFAEDFARRAGMAIQNARILKEAEAAREAERRLRNAADDANRTKDEFLAMVSHELRTPLNAMLGWAVVLRSRNPPESIDHGLAIIERNARRQARLVDDILDFARIISGKTTLRLETVNLAALVERTLEGVQAAADAKEIAFAVDLDRDLYVSIDADRMQQVIWNLMNNAIKFTPKHGGEIRIEARRKGSDVCISIRDSGEGIGHDALPHVFEPFRQGDASITRAHGGLGLGLAIVRELVHAHGGTIEVTSTGLSQGACFTVTLPMRAIVPPVAEEPPPERVADLRHLDGLRILVVDDEPDAREIVETVLTAEGAVVQTVASVDEAMHAVLSLRPDVIVSDIGMPGTDGYAFIRKLRVSPKTYGGDTPAIALTAHAHEEDAVRAADAGFDRHLVKPVDPKRLVDMVVDLARRHH